MPPPAAQEAERLHRQVLAAKERCFGPQDIRTATTLNSLGALLRKRGELQEAETLLRRAVEIREAAPGEAFDAAVSRDELGCVLQAAGRPAEAREMRLRAGTAGLICSYAPCSKTAQQAGVPLRACSRCRCFWYCGPSCQRGDRGHHKRVSHGAAGRASAGGRAGARQCSGAVRVRLLVVSAAEPVDSFLYCP